jgi:nucleoside-diphosphate-sugar epimerase
MKVVLLGGTRFLGVRVAELLVAAGVSVTIVHRGQTGEAVHGATTVHGDRSQPGGLDGLQGRFDAVLDLSAYQSAWTRAAIDALAGRVGFYAFVSSGAVYRPSEQLPWPEETPLGPIPIWGAYGREKVASEQMLFEAHQGGLVEVTAFRFPFILGPANFVDRESFVLSRIEARQPILLPGGGLALNQFVHVDDAARALVRALERPDVASGKAYNCAHPQLVTNRGFVDLCASVAGRPAEVIELDEAAAGVASDTVDLTNITFPFPNEHYGLDAARLERELGVVVQSPPRRMIEDFAGWWESHPDHRPRRYEREDTALRVLGKQPPPG